MKVLVTAAALLSILAASNAQACISAVSKEEIYTVNVPGAKEVTLRVNADGVQSSILKIHQALPKGPVVNYDHDVLASVVEEDGTVALIPAKMGEYDTAVAITYEKSTPVVQRVHVIYKPGTKCAAAD